MKDFVVLTKPVNAKGHSGFSYEYYQIRYLIQQTFKEDLAMQQRFQNFKIDESTIKLEVMNGQLHIVCIAFDTRGDK